MRKGSRSEDWLPFLVSDHSSVESFVLRKDRGLQNGFTSPSNIFQHVFGYGLARFSAYCFTARSITTRSEQS